MIMELMKPDEAARYIGLSKGSLMLLVHSGKVISHRIGPKGGRYRFLREDLDAYLERSRKVGKR